MPRLIDSCGLCTRNTSQARTYPRIYFSRYRAHAAPFLSSVGSTLIYVLLCKTLWHYVIHYGLRLRYILLYIATLTYRLERGQG